LSIIFVIKKIKIWNNNNNNNNNNVQIFSVGEKIETEKQKYIMLDMKKQK
jgi:hypothetical protein